MSHAINFGLLVLIWLVQLIIYPGMHGWDIKNFATLHQRYTQRIAVLVGPLMLAQALLLAHRIITDPDLVVTIQIFLAIFTWGVTIFISVPLHRTLSNGYSSLLIHRLVATNWLRTFAWTLISLMDWIGE